MTSNSYDFSLAAAVGASQQVFVSGSKLKVLEAAGGMVEVSTSNGSKYRLMEGQGFSLENDQFDWVIVRNLLPTAIAGRIFVGDSNFIDDRITGNVSIVDGSRDVTSAGSQFFGSAAFGAAALRFPIIGIRSVTKKVFVRSILVGSTSAGLITLFSCNGDPTSAPAIGAGVGRNLIAGVGAASSAKSIGGDAAAASPTAGELPGVATFATLLVTTSEMLRLEFPRPILLQPGMGLVMVANIAATTVFMAMDFEEV